MEENQKNKSFKAKRAGRKAEKKEKQDKKKRGLSTDKKNVKAFQKKPIKNLRRLLDMQERKLHVPIQNRTYGDPPPTVVAIVGPPKSGKTTLIKSLLKHYTKRKVSEVKGPITVRGGKNRFTFIECDNDMNSYIDTAKVADVVLLLINAKVGFEMESFEFINILQNHGFTKVMGVLTHLDTFKDNKKVKEIKKTMKHRFWKEVVEGSKVFYLSGVRSDLYTPREMLNLGRFLSLIKPRPLTWRTTHPAVLVDRVEDLTNPEIVKSNPKGNRHICLYGYVRGTFLKQKMNVHIPGVGDFQINSSASLEDPLPKILKDRRSINDKYRGIYGPMSNMGDLFYDKDSIYLTVKESKKGEEEAQLLEELQGNDKSIDNLIQTQKFNIFKSNDDEEEDQEEEENLEEEQEDEQDQEEEKEDKDEDELEENTHSTFDQFSKFIHKTRRRANFEKMVQPEEEVKEKIEFEDDEDEDDEIALPQEEKKEELGSSNDQWKEKINEKTNQLFYSRTLSLYELIYGSNTNPIKIDNNEEDLTKHFLPKDEILDWDEPEIQNSIRNKFVTGDWNQRRSKKEEKKEKMVSVDEQDEELDDYAGGFEDVEGKEDLGDEDQIDEEGNEEGEEEEEEEDEEDEKYYERKRKEKKKKFDSSYDAKGEEGDDERVPTSIAELQKKYEVKDPQVILNKTEFEGMEKAQRELIEGYSPGTYVRLEFKDFPYQFIENLDFTKPIIVGGLHPEESRMGFINMRLKKHRWFPKILKNRDPLIFSIGWRRFQSIPIFSMQDANLRQRMIKYTPQHMHCVATIYGPLVPQNTGIIAIQNLSNSVSTFRISANGYTMEFDQNISIVKKLKLIGYPNEIKKHTVFVTGMFNSSLEVAKFEGAQLRTVSGLRGQIKKAVPGGKEGEFRATFEDKLLKSDIIFLRTWVPVEQIKFYNPVTNLLTKKWVAMRTTNQIRKVKGIEFKVPEESEYKEVERRSRTGHEIEMKIPKNLKKVLPFEDQEKEVVEVHGITQKFLSKDAPVNKLTEALLSSKERKRANIIQKMKAIDAFRNKQETIRENKVKLEETRKKLREEKVVNQKVKKNLKRRYILQTEKRVKKAKYSVDEN